MSGIVDYCLVLGMLVLPAIVLCWLGTAILGSIFLNQSVLIALPFP